MSEEKTVDIESMSSKEALGYFLPKVDEDARKAKKEGRLVCWSASVAPPEFCTAMDIAIVYPETHAAGIGAVTVLRPCSKLLKTKVTTRTSVPTAASTWATWNSSNSRL